MPKILDFGLAKLIEPPTSGSNEQPKTRLSCNHTQLPV